MVTATSRTASSPDSTASSAVFWKPSPEQLKGLGTATAEEQTELEASTRNVRIQTIDGDHDTLISYTADDSVADLKLKYAEAAGEQLSNQRWCMFAPSVGVEALANHNKVWEYTIEDGAEIFLGQRHFSNEIREMLVLVDTLAHNLLMKTEDEAEMEAKRVTECIDQLAISMQDTSMRNVDDKSDKIAVCWADKSTLLPCPLCDDSKLPGEAASDFHIQWFLADADAVQKATRKFKRLLKGGKDDKLQRHFPMMGSSHLSGFNKPNLIKPSVMSLSSGTPFCLLVAVHSDYTCHSGLQLEVLRESEVDHEARRELLKRADRKIQHALSRSTQRKAQKEMVRGNDNGFAAVATQNLGALAASAPA